MKTKERKTVVKRISTTTKIRGNRPVEKAHWSHSCPTVEQGNDLFRFFLRREK